MVLDLSRTAYQFWLGHKAPFELVGLAMTLCGILFAMFSIRDGRKLTKDLRSIFNHLTTKEIGAFPAYLNEVDRLISEARESIFIATDFPGHGAWGDRGRYGAYVKALENRKADRVRRGHALSIQGLCLKPAARDKALQDRFPDSRWRDYLKKGGFGRTRRRYGETDD